MPTIIICALVAAVIFLAARQIYKDKKLGKSVCGCKCHGCPNSQICHGKKS